MVGQKEMKKNQNEEINQVSIEMVKSFPQKSFISLSTDLLGPRRRGRPR